VGIARPRGDFTAITDAQFVIAAVIGRRDKTQRRAAARYDLAR
jgi:hypothetical protein